MNLTITRHDQDGTVDVDALDFEILDVQVHVDSAQVACIHVETCAGLVEELVLLQVVDNRVEIGYATVDEPVLTITSSDGTALAAEHGNHSAELGQIQIWIFDACLDCAA